MASCTLTGGSIQVGNQVRATGTFTNAAYDYFPIDPTNVFVDVTDPNGTVTTIAWPDASMTNPSVGVYYIETTLDTDGTWFFRWYSSGNATCSTEVSVRVLT